MHFAREGREDSSLPSCVYVKGWTASGCVAQLVEQRSPKPQVGGSRPSALEGKKCDGEDSRVGDRAEKEKVFWQGLSY